MGLTVLRIEMPKNGDWGTLQINNFTHVHYRFEFKEGKPVLDNSFFIDNKEPEDRHRRFANGDEFYQRVQDLLTEHIEGLNLMDAKKEQAFVNEKQDLLRNMLEQTYLMNVAIKSLDAELLEKMKRDFNHRLEQMDFVEKRR